MHVSYYRSVRDVAYFKIEFYLHNPESFVSKLQVGVDFLKCVFETLDV